MEPTSPPGGGKGFGTLGDLLREQARQGRPATGRAGLDLPDGARCAISCGALATPSGAAPTPPTEESRAWPDRRADEARRPPRLGGRDRQAHQAGPDRLVRRQRARRSKRLTEEAVAAKVLIPLDQKKWPGCYYHHSNQNDVARVEHLTFICTPDQGGGRPHQQLDGPGRGLREARAAIFDGCMKGRTMYVVPYVMGPAGSPFAKVGIELTDSVYVALNMGIMTRMGKVALDRLGDSERLQPGAPLGRRLQPGPALHLPLPPGQHHLVGRLGLRRQRAARQEVPGAAHRQLPGQEGGLAGRAHAHPRGREPGGRDAATWPPPSRRPAARPTSP